MAKVYAYGMRTRGDSPSEPEGLVDREYDPLDDYLEVLLYNRKLPREEAERHDLDFLGVRER